MKSPAHWPIEACLFAHIRSHRDIDVLAKLADPLSPIPAPLHCLYIIPPNEYQLELIRTLVSIWRSRPIIFLLISSLNMLVSPSHSPMSWFSLAPKDLAFALSNLLWEHLSPNLLWSLSVSPSQGTDTQLFYTLEFHVWFNSYLIH